MQRPSNSGDHLPGGPLAVNQPSGGLAPAGFQQPFGGSYLNQPVMPGGQPDRAWPTLTELVNALKRRLVLATFLGVLVGIAAASAVWLALPSGKHKVRSLIQVKPLVSVTNQQILDNFEDFKKSQQRAVFTRDVLNMVVGDPQVARLNMMTTADDPAQYLEELIKVSWESPELMAVSMSGDDHAQLRVLVDSVTHNFIETAKSGDIRLSTARRKRMEETLKDLDERILARRKEIERLQKSSGAGSDAQSTAFLIAAESQNLTNLRKDIYEEERKVRELEISVQRQKQTIAAAETAPLDQADLEQATRSDPVVQERLAARTAADKRHQNVLVQYEASSDMARNAQAALRKADTELRATLETLRPQVEAAARAARKKAFTNVLAADQESLAMRREMLTGMVTMRQGVEQRIKDLTLNGAGVKVEDDDLKPLLAQRDIINQKLIEQAVGEKQEARIMLREGAQVLLNQTFRQKVLVSLGAFAGGTLLVMAAIGFLEWRSRRVDSVDQVVNELGMRVIGTIPAFPSKQSLKSGDAAQSQNWRFVLNESVNSARTMLLHTAKTQNMQVLMVTSAMQGEGKTSLASQLATSMATAGLRTLILDCDLRNPSMHKLFDAQLAPGCSEVLCQEVDVSDAVQPTSVPNLWLIPAGQCSNRVIAALAQGHPLETLFNRLRGQFDFIVVDSCPVLPVADTLLVGQHVDGVVLSILQDISQLPKVQTTAERLTQLNIPLLGTVVNGIKPDVHAYGYNYVKQLPA